MAAGAPGEEDEPEEEGGLEEEPVGEGVGVEAAEMALHAMGGEGAAVSADLDGAKGDMGNVAAADLAIPAVQEALAAPIDGGEVQVRIPPRPGEEEDDEEAEPEGLPAMDGAWHRVTGKQARGWEGKL